MTQDPRDPKKSDFLAAEEVKGILAGRDPVEQQRIVRWVCESLELSFVPRPEPSDATAQTSKLKAAETPTTHHGSHERAHATDIRSFSQHKQPKSDVQFVAVVAYFFRFVAKEANRKDAILADDVQEAARLAQRSVFKSPSTTLNNAVKQGYLDRAARGAFRLNTVGENLVAMTLPGTRTARSQRRKPGCEADRTSVTRAQVP